MAYIKSNPHQTYLIPPKLTDLFSENHVCYLIEQISDSLDYSEFDKKYAGVGAPAYHPRVNLKLLMMANVDGMRSSRKIAKNAQENAVYIYLAEKLQPDFRTISDFRKDNPQIVEQVFLKLSQFAYEHGLIDLSHLIVDGSTIQANANNNRVLDKATIKKLRKYIRKEIERGIKVDEEEDKIYGDRGLHQLPEDLNTSEKRRPIVRKIVDEINKAMKEDNKQKVAEIDSNLEQIGEAMERDGFKKYSMTDPDARFMLSKKGLVKLNYNAQLVVDKSGIIISNDVVQNPDDRNQLLPNIRRIERDFGKLPAGTKISMDQHYSKGEALLELDAEGFDLYAPLYGMSKAKKNKFDKVNFIFDHDNDRYICPEGKFLENRGKTFNKKAQSYRTVYKTSVHDCRPCPYKQECANKMGYKMILALAHDKLLQRIKAKLLSPEGRATYNLRKQTVEPAFGDIKENKKFRRFLLRGKEKVKIEWNLVCLASNLVKINNLLNKRRLNLATAS